MESKLERLSINQDPPKKQKAGPKNKYTEIVADSWDDEPASGDSDTGVEHAIQLQKSSVPNTPPPTPAFPSWEVMDPNQVKPWIDSRDSAHQRRSEKSTAAAGRLIAAGLGMRAPKKTEEQRAYERAMRENEIKRRNKEKEARDKEREENEKAQTLIWES